MSNLEPQARGDPPSPEAIARVRRIVRKLLPASYDRDFIADSIVINAWLKNVPHISYGHIRHKCISAWRARQRECRRNEGFVNAPDGHEISPVLSLSRKDLVEKAIMTLPFLERKLIWYRFWAGLTLEEMSERTNLPRKEIQALLQGAIYKMRIELT